MENIENADNMEKMENINQNDPQLMIQNTLFVTQNTLFGNRMTKTLYLIAVMSTVKKS